MRPLCFIAVAFLFTTNAAFSQGVVRSSSPAAAIDNLVALCTSTDGTGGASDTIMYTEVGTISDVNVRTEIQHTWRGDLQFDLQYDGGGGVVVLAADHDGSADDYYATFDDESANGACGAGAGICEMGTPTDCTPDSPLTVFDGLTSPGTWTMRVCDDAGGDAGTWNLWEMTVDGDGGLPVELMGFSVE